MRTWHRCKCLLRLKNYQGQEIKVKVLDVDQRGRIKLSIKELLEDEAAEAPAEEAAE